MSSPSLHSFQGNFADAEPLFRKAWSIYEKEYGADDLRVAVSINNLAGVLCEQVSYAVLQRSEIFVVGGTRHLAPLSSFV